MPVLVGTSGADFLVSPGAYVVDGGAGDDVIVSNGHDVLTGGDGDDTFVFPLGTTFGTVITDWHKGDHLAFAVGPDARIQGGVGGPGIDAVARGFISRGQADIFVADQGGGVVVIYVDSRNDNTVGDMLVFTGVQSIPFQPLGAFPLDSTFVSAPPAPPAPPPPAAPLGGGMALQGGVYGETLQGGLFGDILLGGGGDDLLVGKDGADTLNGEFGYDSLQGGAGADRLTGDGENNVFIIAAADSPADPNQGGGPGHIDLVTDWNATDYVKVIDGPVATATNFVSLGSAADYASAYAMAQEAFRYRAGDYVAVQVGGDVVLFAPGVGAAVLLSGASLSALTERNVGSTPPLVGPDFPLRTAAFVSDANDLLQASVFNNTIDGGGGNDTIVGMNLTDYLRGGDGNDSILATGGDFDDINGNKGADTIVGGPGGDWLVGGQGDDHITSLSGDAILYGNLGNDTLHGGTGNELIRGGQGNDALAGGAGKDWLSGDRGDDTLVGGAGADVFHTFNGAGLDLVGDFNAAEGDRVQLDPGTTYTLRQVGADTIVDLGNGDQMVLKGVSLASLPPDWIFIF